MVGAISLSSEKYSCISVYDDTNTSHAVNLPDDSVLTVCMGPINPSSPTVTASFDGVMSDTVLIDSGNLSQCVMTETLAHRIASINLDAIQDTIARRLRGFADGGSSVMVTQKIVVEELRVIFPNGGERIEEKVEFLIVPDDCISGKTDVLISNKFLLHRWKFDIISQLEYHLLDRNTTDVGDSIPSKGVFACSLEDLESILEDDDFTDMEDDEVAQKALQVGWQALRKAAVAAFAEEIEDKRSNGSTAGSLPPATKKSSILFDIAGRKDISICVKADMENRVVIQMETTAGVYTFPVEVAEGMSGVRSPTSCAGVTPESAETPQSVLTCEEKMVSLDEARRARKRHRILQLLRKYEEPYTCTDSDGLVNTASDQLLRPVEVVDSHRRQGDLSRYGASRKAYENRNVRWTPYQFNSKDEVDITNLASEELSRTLKRQYLKKKMRLLGRMARLQIPVGSISESVINTVLIDGKDLTTLVHENMDRVRREPTNDVEYDPTIIRNPKAFWFGEPESEAERKALIAERLAEARVRAELSEEQLRELEELVNEFHLNCRTRLGNDMEPRLEPMKVQLREGAVPKIIKAYPMKPETRAQMRQQVNELETASLIKGGLGSAWAAPIQMVPKPGSTSGELRLVINYKYINSCLLPIQGPMPILQDALRTVQGSQYFLAADFLKGYWQCPLHEDSQDYFAFLTGDGMYKPVRIPQGAASSPIWFHNQLSIVFKELIESDQMILWIDDCLLHAKDWKSFLTLVRRFFELVKSHQLQVNIKKTDLCCKEASFCGRIVSGKGVRMQARSSDAFLNASLPTTAGHLSEFLMGLNWMRGACDNIGDTKPCSAEHSFASLASPLWQLLTAAYDKCDSRKKNRYKNVSLDQLGWTEVHTEAFRALQAKFAKAIEEAFVIPGARLCLFTDASDDFYAAMLTQVQEWDEAKEVHEQVHDIVACLSGEFKNSECNWRINEKEAYPIIVALNQWDYMLTNPEGFAIYGDHKNLIHLFSPESINPPLTKGALHRVYNWLHLLGQYRITTMRHIAGELNVWADMLSRWMNPNFADAIKRTVRLEDSVDDDLIVMNMQEEAEVAPKKRKSSRKAAKGAMKTIIANAALRLGYAHGTPCTEIPSDQVIKFAQQYDAMDEADLKWKQDHIADLHLDPSTGMFRYKDKGWWIPRHNTDLLVRMCIGAHCSEAGHRSTEVTCDYLKKYVWWEDMDGFVQSFIDSCLVCVKHKSSSHTVPRPLGSQLKATQRGEILCMDYMYIGKHAANHNYEYILVLKDKFSGYVELIPCESPNSVKAAESIGWWIARFTKPKYLMSDRGTHFTAKLIHELSKFFNIEHHFTTAYCPWSNGSVERVNRDIKGLLKVMVQSSGTESDMWPYLLPAVMNVINSTSSATLGGFAPKEIFVGMPRYDPFQYIISSHGKEAIDNVLDTIDMSSDKVKAHFVKLKASLDTMYEEIQPKVLRARNRVTLSNEKQNFTQATRARRAKELGLRPCEVTSDMCIPRFAVGDYVLVAIPKQPKNHKLQAIWRGPYRIIRTISDYVYEVEHVVSKSVSEHHVSRLQFYADRLLDVNIPLLHDELVREESFAHSYDIHSIVSHGYNRDSDGYELLIRWSGFSELENSWEPVDSLIKQVPRLVKEYVLSLANTDVHKKTLLGLLS